MNRRIRSIVVLILAMNCFVGCTKYADVSFEEAGREERTQIRRIILANTIEGVVLHNGEELHFNEQCGRYDKKEQTIIGKTTAGENVAMPLDQISDVITSSTGISGSARRRISKARFLLESAMYGWEEFYGRDVQRRDTMIVEPSSVKLDTENRMMVAATAYGSQIDVPHDRVFLQKKKVDALKTAGFVAGISTMTAFALFVIGMGSSGANIP